MSEPLLSQLQWGKRRRLPLLLQTEAAECGLACLAMVGPVRMAITSVWPSCGRAFSVSLKGSTAADLVRMADGLGMACRALRAEPGHLARMQLPCILHWDFKHFVVLAEVNGDQVVVHDPAHGRRTMPMAELSRHFTGVALELRPGGDFQTRAAAPAPSLRQLLGRVTGLRRALGQAMVLALALELLVLLSPFLLQWVVDGVLVGADRDLLATLGLGFGLLVLLQVAVGALRSWAVLAMSASLNLQWLSNVFAHLLRLPQAWFDKRSLGEIWSRFGSVQQIQRTLTTRFVEAVLDGLMVIVTLAMMWLYSPRLSLIALLAVAGYGALRWAFYRPLHEATEEALIHEAKQNGFFIESLRGAPAIKLFNAEPARSARFSNLVVEQMNASLGVRRLELWMGVSHKLLFGLERVAIVCLGAWLVLERELSVGMLFAYLAYKEQFSTRLAGLIDKGVELAMLKLQGQRLADIVLSAPEQRGPALPLAAGATLELHEVSFRYADGEPEVIKGCSFSIAPGESVAVVGPSGCGKTTLMKLMLGMHEPQSGQVLVGGQPLQKLGLQSWRSAVGTVMQDDQLFAGSIADNISFFEPGADQTWVRECARLACVEEEIEALPMAYQSLVSDMGSSLSGGQRQRILLARALYKRPQFLLLDEATSALDVERERALNASLRQLPLTRIVIAHRPETIAAAQRVIALQGGRVAQDLRSLSA